MYSNVDLTKAIKLMSNQSVISTYPVNIVIGTVIGLKPLKISIGQKLILEEQQIVLTRNVTDFYIDMTVNHFTENKSGGSGESAFSSHNHGYVGRKTFLVHNSLVIGDKVVMAQEQGGQSYFVFDRVGGDL